MGIWSFIGGCALFNLLRNLFSGNRKPTYPPTLDPVARMDHEEYMMMRMTGRNNDASQNHDNWMSRPLRDSTAARYDSVDEYHDRIDCLEEWEETQDEIDDLREEWGDYEYEADLYDDDTDW
jgi:hypothetical protein